MLLWRSLLHVRRLIFGPPCTTDPRRLRVANTLQYLLTGTLVGCVWLLLVAVPFLVARRGAVVAMALGLLASSAWGIVLLRRGRERAAAAVCVVTGWLIASSQAVASGGVRSVSLALYVPICVIAGLLLGRGWSLAAAGSGALVSLALAIVEWSGHLPPAYFPMPPLGALNTMLAALFLSAIPMNKLLAELEGALEQSERQLADLRVARDALAESEDRHRAIFSTARDAIFLADAETSLLVDANPAAEELLGYSVAELRGMHQSRLHPLEAEAEATRLFELGPDEAGHPEILMERRDGSTIAVECNYSRIRTADGRRLVVGVFRNITERKRAQEEKARLEEQLVQARKLESIGQLAAGVAHDFNNLLTVVNGYSAMGLKELPAGHPLRQRLEAIHAAGEHAADLTRQLLAFSRKQVLRTQPLSLNEAANSAAAMLRRVLSEDIELIFRLEPGLAPVEADPSQFLQILLNLAANARDAMPCGGRLIISTFSVPPEVTPWHSAGSALEVADTGVGMTPEVCERAFDPFFTTKGMARGTGLGLATVYGIVKQHGGAITVSSEVGRGSTFRILLPAAAPQHSSPVPEKAAASPRSDGATILIIEDQQDVLVLMSSILSQAGYRVIEASGGAQGIEAAAAHDGPIHLVLADVVMPGMPGPAAVRELQKTRPGLRVLYVSGHPQDAVLNRSLIEGSGALLSKPFTPEVLLQHVADALASPQPASGT